MKHHKPRKRDLEIIPFRESSAPQSETQASRSSQPSSPSSSGLLFVEVRGGGGSSSARDARRQALHYNRSKRELKSHVMLVANRTKRQQQAGNGKDLIVGSQRASLIVDLGTRLSPELSPEHVDPFNMLPVEGTPELHTAIRYYFEHYPGPTPLTDDWLVCDKNASMREQLRWSRVQFSFCRDARITYYMILFIWKIMKQLSNPTTAETLQYWSTVLQLIREEMPVGKTGLDIPESYVGMIAGMSVAETWFGNFQNSQQHRCAMLKLVAARGGFSTFGPMAQRAIKWCEFYACAAAVIRPVLPRLPVLPLPSALVKKAEAAHRRTVALLPHRLAQSELNIILFQLHVVMLGQGDMPQTPVASVLDDLAHRLLEMLAKYREKSLALTSTNQTDVVYYALLQAAHMCVYGTTSFVRKEMPLCVFFVATLRHMLNLPRVVDAWIVVASTESLLWVLFIGWAAASQLRGDSPGAMENARWLMLQSFRCFELLGLEDEEDLHESLQKFPWSEESYRERCNALWSLYLDREHLNII